MTSPGASGLSLQSLTASGERGEREKGTCLWMATWLLISPLRGVHCSPSDQAWEVPDLSLPKGFPEEAPVHRGKNSSLQDESEIMSASTAGRILSISLSPGEGPTAPPSPSPRAQGKHWWGGDPQSKQVPWRRGIHRKRS